MTSTAHEPAVLHGLILAGGHSTRMQRDKALLNYGGRAQAEETFNLVSDFTRETFLSCRQDQWQDTTFAHLPQIHDTVTKAGPMAGILSAFAQRPNAAWLVVACDLPFVDASTLQELIHQRDAEAPATAYRSTHGGLPEPLCAIYEPTSCDILQNFLSQGIRCPRKVLINSPTKLIHLQNPRALDNINHADEYEQARQVLQQTSNDRMKIHIRYFAQLREWAGKEFETRETSAAFPSALYQELAEQYQFHVHTSDLRAAVNNEFVDMDVRLQDGDEIAFIPPVAGG